MPNNKLTLIRKLRAVEELKRTGNVGGTARKFHVQPKQIRDWRKNYAKIKEIAEKSPCKVTINCGR